MTTNLRLGSLFVIVFLLLSSSSQNNGKVNKNELKFNPGHYVAVGPSFPIAEIKHLAVPAVIGVNKRYYWRTLELEKGVYDFSSIKSDLQFLESNDKQLIVFLIDRSFWKKGAMPKYLSEYEIQYDHGFCPIRFHPYVVERFVALGKAIGEHFDRHPNFEGVAIQETSIDLSDEDLKRFDYTPEKYRDALITILNGLQDGMPNSLVFWYQNGMYENPELLRKVAESVSDSRVIMGGPDILPYRRWVRMSYPKYDEFKNRLTLFCSAQDDSYMHHRNDIRITTDEPIPDEGYLSMEDIFLFARDSLHVRYLFWTYYYEGVEYGARSYDDAIKVIQECPVFNRSIGPLDQQD